MKIKMILFGFTILFYQKAYSSNVGMIKTTRECEISLQFLVQTYLFHLGKRIENGEMAQILDEIGSLTPNLAENEFEIKDNDKSNILSLISAFLMHPKINFITQDILDSLEKLIHKTFLFQDKNTVLQIQILLRNKDTFRQFICYMIEKNLIPLYFQNYYIQCLGIYSERRWGSYGDDTIFHGNTISDFNSQLDDPSRNLLTFIWLFQATQSGKPFTVLKVNLPEFFEDIGNDLVESYDQSQTRNLIMN